VCCIVVVRRLSRKREVRRSIVLAPLVVLLLGLGAAVVSLHNTAAEDLLLFAYSPEQAGNTIRDEQRGEILADVNVPGRGLGAPLRSGYSRDELGYGFELSFENAIHKFGIMSGFLFLAYIASLWSFARATFAPGLLGAGVAGFSGMLYLIPAAGNPTLFAPVCVTLHVFLLLWLRAEQLGDRVAARASESVKQLNIAKA